MWKIPVPIKTVPSEIPPLHQNKIPPKDQNNTNNAYKSIKKHYKNKFVISTHPVLVPQYLVFKTIKTGYFTTFPNITTALVTKYLTNTTASAKGRLD